MIIFQQNRPVFPYFSSAETIAKMIFGTQGTSAHKQVMKENFGGSVEVLYGDLECPSNQWTSAKHVTQVGAGVDFELLSNSLTCECRNPQLPQVKDRVR